MDTAQEIDASMGLHDDVSNDKERISDLGDTKVKSGTANAVFHANLPTCDVSNDLNAACKRLSGVIYDYFETHCGKVNTDDSAN